MAIEKNLIKKDTKSNYNNLKERILSGNYKIYLSSQNINSNPNDNLTVDHIKNSGVEITKVLDIANIDLTFREDVKIFKPFGSLYEVAIGIPAGIDINMSFYKNGSELQVLMTDIYMNKNGANLNIKSNQNNTNNITKSPFNPFSKEIHSNESTNSNNNNQKTLGTSIFNKNVISENESSLYNQPEFELLIEIILPNLQSETYIFPNVRLFNYKQSTSENLAFINESITIHAPSIIRIEEPINLFANLASEITKTMLNNEKAEINNQRIINPNNKDLYEVN